MKDKNRVSYPLSQIDSAVLLNQILEELRHGDYSIFKRYRRKELNRILELDYKKVPVEFPNLIFKRLMEKKGKNCPISLICFSIQCLGYYFLKINGLEECSVEIIKSGSSFGSANETGIEISKQYAPSLRKGRVEVLDTLFHEINHEIQIKKKHEKNVSFCTYEWIQDTLLYAFIGDAYYNRNYGRISIEVDSRIRGSVLAYRYLNEICPKAAQKMKRKVYRKAKKEVEGITLKRSVGFLFTTREELFDELISKKKVLLEFYPVLKKFYNEDGTKKLLAEILLEYKGMKEKKEYYEVRYSKEELKTNEDYKKLLADMSFYMQFLKNRVSSYENTRNDYLSITASNIPFLQACANDEWLENERNRYLTKFERKYAILSHLGQGRSAPFVEETISSMNNEMRNIERVCASTGKIGILRRTVISIQRIWIQTIKNSFSNIKFKDEPIEHLGVDLKQNENNIRK